MPHEKSQQLQAAYQGGRAPTLSLSRSSTMAVSALSASTCGNSAAAVISARACFKVERTAIAAFLAYV